MKRYGEISKNILLMLGVVGVIVVVAAAPGALLAVKLFEQKRFSREYDKQKMARTFKRLQKNNLIQIREKDGRLRIELTKKGRKKFGDIQLQSLRIAKPEKWDKKWRIVIFDIPDKSFRRGRDALRGKLKEWEFYQLQKSVWVCPWPCEKEIQVIAALYDILPYVNIVVAEKITEDAFVRKHFRL